LLEMGRESDDFSPHHGQPVSRPGDARYEHLDRKHGQGRKP
jgi:hypothetical protein